MIRLALFLSLALATLPGLAAAGAFSVKDVVQAELLPGWEEAAGTRMAGLRIHLAPGWHTYWRAPGDAGVPPSFDWSASANLGRVAVLWPAPKVFDLNGLRTAGYDGTVVLPLRVTAAGAGAVGLRGAVEIGVCREICVPVELTVSAELAGQGAPDAEIAAALRAVPEARTAEALCAVSPTRDGLHVEARIPVQSLGVGEAALVESGDPAIWVGDVTTARQGGVLVAGADLVPSEAAPILLDRSKLRFTLLGSGRAVEVDGCSGG